MHMCHKILDNAIFVADSHYNERRNEFLAFLQKLQTKEIITSQLFLMGDMFDFISGESSYFIKKNIKVINIINELSSSMEIIYLEGNHDYNMQNIFPKLKVYSRTNQPLNMTYQDKKVSLSHGDIFVADKFYDIYCNIIRNKTLLKFLNLIDFNNFISKKIYYTLIEKNICNKIENFNNIVHKRIKHYDSDIVIEGHFHQGNEYMIENKRYKNIQSLTCSNEYVVLKDNSFVGVKL